MNDDERVRTRDEYIRAMVDSAPPLTPEQRDRIALLLRPSSHAGDDELGERT